MSDTIRIGSLILAQEGDAVTFDDLTGTRQVQVSMPVRAQNASVIDRRNRVVSLTFTRTTAPHASVSAARVFMIDHDEAIAALENAEPLVCAFEYTTPGGAAARYLQSAVIASHRARQRGLTTYHTYTLQGSSWQNTAAS